MSAVARACDGCDRSLHTGRGWSSEAQPVLQRRRPVPQGVVNVTTGTHIHHPVHYFRVLYAPCQQQWCPQQSASAMVPGPAFTVNVGCRQLVMYSAMLSTNPRTSTAAQCAHATQRDALGVARCSQIVTGLHIEICARDRACALLDVTRSARAAAKRETAADPHQAPNAAVNARRAGSGGRSCKRRMNGESIIRTRGRRQYCTAAAVQSTGRRGHNGIDIWAGPRCTPACNRNDRDESRSITRHVDRATLSSDMVQCR